MNCDSSINCSVDSPIESTQRSIISCPPKSANDAEKMDEPTNSQHTIALVFAVKKEDSLMMPPKSRAVFINGLALRSRLAAMNRYAPAKINPPSAPTAAASVGVAKPNTMEPSTAMIMTASGKNEANSILKISSRCQFIIRVMSARAASPSANTIQYHWGTGSRTAACAAGLTSAVLLVVAEDAEGAAAAAGVATGAVVAEGGSANTPNSFGGSARPPTSFGGSARPPASAGFSSSAVTPPPACTRPVVSNFSAGAVALKYITPRRAAIAMAGSSEMSSCADTERFDSAPSKRPDQSPATALLPLAASAVEREGRGTKRSASESGGAR